MAPIVAKRRKLSHSPDMGDLKAATRMSGGSLHQHGSSNIGTGGNRTKVGNEPGSRAPSRLAEATTDELLLSQSSHKSSLLKLQLDELLTGLRPNFDKLTSRLKPILTTLKGIIESIPQAPAQSIHDAEKALKKAGVAVPWPQPNPTKDAKYKVEYLPPIGINVVKGFALKIGSRNDNPRTIDLAITLPPQAFQEKDYLNHRYFHKRAYFIACFAAAIKQASADEFEINFAFVDDVQLLPCIIIRPGKSASNDLIKSKCEIRLITALSEDTFSHEKTSISKNCVRSTGTPDPGHDASLEPTPFYNSCLRSEMSVASYLSLLSKVATSCEGFADACLLGSTWLRQRGFDSAIFYGGIGMFEWATICALLLQGGGSKGRPALSLRYNSYQLFQGVLQLFADRDLSDPMVIGQSSNKIPKLSAPVFYDVLRGVNVLHKMSPWSYHLLKHDAQATLNALNEKLHDNFDAAFIARLQDPTTRFDQLARVDLPSVFINQNSTGVLEHLHDVLSRGLGDRASLIHLKGCHVRPWPLKRACPQTTDDTIEIGLLLHAENASRLVDRGPTAEEKEAAADFRQFWGEKAELRRFRDGTIAESLVWSEHDPNWSIIHQILSALLSQHFNLPASSSRMVGDQIELEVGLQPVQASFQTLIETYQAFSAKLHVLEGLPLSIRSLSASDEQLSFASLRDPIKSLQPANIVVQFEGSNRWPDALTAIQRTKIAFLTRIGDLLESSDDPLSTRLGLENTGNSLLNVAYLDIFFPKGTVFRLRIHNEREQTLLERQLKDKELPGRSRDELALALAIYKRDYIHSPRHTQAIRSLCTRFPALSTTIRMFKKWISSHLLCPFFSSQLLDILCAQVFIRPHPWTTPSTPSTAFLRVLASVSKWDWLAEPLIVDLGPGEMTSTEMSTINVNFQAWRKVDPALNTVVLFVASDIDPSGVIWTQGSHPPKVVATRLTALARASTDAVRSQGLDLDIPSLFRSPLTQFDFLLHLKPKLARQYRSPTNTHNHKPNGTSKFKNLQIALNTPVPDPESIGYDPISLYLSDLTTTFSSQTVLFFHDSDAGDVIAGLWNPRSTDGLKDFRVRIGVSTRPSFGMGIEANDAYDEDMDVDGDDAGNEKETVRDKVEINKPGMLAEMAMLGEGIVEHVEVLKE